MPPSPPVADTAATRPPASLPRWLLVAPVALILAGVGKHEFDEYQKALAQRIADAKAWAIDGPRCPEITKTAFLAPHQKGLRRFDFEGATFFRRVGHVSCAAIRDNGGRGARRHAVCQFTSPADLMVRTDAGDWYFRPGPGSPATVSTAGPAPTCVMASKFSLRPEADGKPQPGA